MKSFIYALLVVYLLNQVSTHPDTYTGNAEEMEIQNQIKEFVAQYLVETGDALDAGRFLENSLPIEFGKHHHHRYPISQLPVQAAALPVLSAPVAASPVINNEAARVDTQTQNPITNTGASVNPIIVGPSAQIPAGQAPAPAPVPAAQAPAPVPAASATAPALSPAPAQLPARAPEPLPVVPTIAPVTLPPRSTVDPVHHLNQVNKILGNVANGNIVGIVDESLAIRAPTPVRTLVTNILKVVFCNPIDRLFRRCAPNQIDAAANSVSGK